MRFLYVRMNARTKQADYNSFVLQYKLTEGWQFIIDFVYDVEDKEIKEITGQEFDMIQRQKYYGTN